MSHDIANDDGSLSAAGLQGATNATEGRSQLATRGGISAGDLHADQGFAGETVDHSIPIPFFVRLTDLSTLPLPQDPRAPFPVFLTVSTTWFLAQRPGALAGGQTTDNTIPLAAPLDAALTAPFWIGAYNSTFVTAIADDGESLTFERQPLPGLDSDPTVKQLWDSVRAFPDAAMLPDVTGTSGTGDSSTVLLVVNNSYPHVFQELKGQTDAPGLLTDHTEGRFGVIVYAKNDDGTDNLNAPLSCQVPAFLMLDGGGDTLPAGNVVQCWVQSPHADYYAFTATDRTLWVSVSPVLVAFQYIGSLAADIGPGDTTLTLKFDNANGRTLSSLFPTVTLPFPVSVHNQIPLVQPGQGSQGTEVMWVTEVDPEDETKWTVVRNAYGLYDRTLSVPATQTFPFGTVNGSWTYGPPIKLMPFVYKKGAMVELLWSDSAGGASYQPLSPYGVSPGALLPNSGELAAAAITNNAIVEANNRESDSGAVTSILPFDAAVQTFEGLVRVFQSQDALNISGVGPALTFRIDLDNGLDVQKVAPGVVRLAAKPATKTTSGVVSADGSSQQCGTGMKAFQWIGIGSPGTSVYGPDALGTGVKSYKYDPATNTIFTAAGDASFGALAINGNATVAGAVSAPQLGGNFDGGVG